jgi:radical SAM superfamily enzyme
MSTSYQIDQRSTGCTAGRLDTACTPPQIGCIAAGRKDAQCTPTQHATNCPAHRQNAAGRFYSASDFYKNLFGCKVYKLSLDAGCTCPTRDGTLGTRGCIFCSAGGSGEFAAPRDRSIADQITIATRLVEKKAIGRHAAKQSTDDTAAVCDGSTAAKPEYIAYFQNFTNTYGDHDTLQTKWEEALSCPAITGIAIATRPDCIDDDMLKRIESLSRRTFVQLELGLQTSNDCTANEIRRAYPTAVYDDTMRRLKQNCITAAAPPDGHISSAGRPSTGLHIVTQLIFGLPGETEQTMLSSVSHAAACGTDGIKITSLYVLKGTDLAADYSSGKFACLSQAEYFKRISDAVELLPPHIVIHRLTGDGPKSLLIAPPWTADKRGVLNSMNKYFADNDVLQGKHCQTAPTARVF